MSDEELHVRRDAMANMTEEQYNNLRRYLEKRSYSVRDEIGKEDYVPRPIVLRSDFVSLHVNYLLSELTPKSQKFVHRTLI